MNYRKILIVVMTIIVIIMSCKKEESYTNDSKVTSSKNQDIAFVAVKSTSSAASDPEFIQLIGNSDINSPDSRYFAISVFANTLQTKTYTIPEYSPGFVYDNSSDYATGYFSLSPSNVITDWYSSQYIPGAYGSVTISSLSGDRVEGAYDLTLVSYNDETKTINLKGNFIANIASTDN